MTTLSPALQEIVNRLHSMPAEKRDIAIREALDATRDKPWIPNEGPQTKAYLSPATLILYGGQAGGGKTQLAIGIGVNDGESGIIFRRELSQTDGLEKDGKEIIGTAASFNGSDHEWTWPDGRTLKLGGMKDADSWTDHAGRERDYIGYDEAGEFLEVQVGSLLAWLRARPGKRVRMVLASNPPRTSEGYWLIEWFAPWIDEQHPDPAQPGEIRYAVYAKGKTVWCDGPSPIEIDGEQYTPISRTFIPASLEDNPYRNTPEYRAQLQSLHEPLRSQLLYGDWKAGFKDAADQAIPTVWVRQAIQRWTPKPPSGIPMCSIGADMSGGGEDPMVQAYRHDGWYGDFIVTEGKDIPRDRAGSHAAGLILATRRAGAMIVVDLGGGYGGPAWEHLQANAIECIGFKGAEATTRRTRDGKLGFTNCRTAAYWGFREALDPDQPGGSPISLTNNPRLLAGLTAPRFKITPRGIELERKVDVVARLGFSPNEADAVVMAWWAGPKETTHALNWAGEHGIRGRLSGQQPRVIMGRQHARRR